MTTDDRYPRQPVPASEIAEPGAAPLALPWVEYPESDGQPMAESDIHRAEMIDLIGRLDRLKSRRAISPASTSAVVLR